MRIWKTGARVQSMLKGGAAAMVLVAMLLGIAPPTRSQDAMPPLPPVLRPIPEKETLPSDGVFDVVGLRLGMTFDEAVAVLTKLNFGQDVQPKEKSFMRMSDSRGNSFGFAYQSTLGLGYENADYAKETIALTFTTNINEARVVSIRRGVSYHDPRDKQPSIPDLIEAVKAKYGPPSWNRRSDNLVSLSWFWINGQRQTLTKIDGMSQCLHADLASAYPYRIPLQGPNCTPIMHVTIHQGASDDRMSAVTFSLVDLERLRQNTKDTDAWVDVELEKVIKSKAGPSGPKL